MTDDLHRKARLMEDELNALISEVCEGKSPFYWQSLAQEIVDNDPRMEHWKFMWATPFGQHPYVVLTQYDPSSYRSEYE